MKTIKITKSNDFSPNSKVILHVGSEKIHLKGFGSFSFSLSPGEEFYLTQQWAGSKIMAYEDMEEGSSFLVKPRLDKRLAFITLLVFIICTIIFFVIESRWSFFPLLPLIIYIILYLSVFRNRYLILQPVNDKKVVRQ